ncbi:MAG: TIGR00153 family protein [Firmicutes bacterium]|jgi:predicted phosphate transport protein (TIGR00153 family)|nr:TIGR00153 family protein [Bacillota bacterium]
MPNIFAWIGARDGRRVLVEVDKHVEKVREVVRLLKDQLTACAAGDMDANRTLHGQVVEAERVADQIRRDLLASLSEGLLLPSERDDLVRFIERLDYIADQANGASRILVLFDTPFPEELAGDLKRFAELLITGTERLKDALDTLYRGTAAETLQKCTEVEEVEEECDRQKAELLSRIFAMDLSAARLLMIHDLIEAMEETADQTEDTADVIRTLAVRMQR